MSEEKKASKIPKRKVPKWRVRLIREGSGPYPRFNSPESVARHFIFLREETVETFHVVFLNTKNAIIGTQEISRGGIDRTIVQPREVFQAAIIANCTKIILVHGHPSGDPAPSIQDKQVHEDLSKAGELLEIEVLDHLIIGTEEYFSFAQAIDVEML